MGRKMKGSKGGKFINPTDQARKEARKRELRKVCLRKFCVTFHYIIFHILNLYTE